MKSRFSRPICWSVLLFCLAYDARADTPSPASKSTSESTAPPARTTSDNKPALIDTEHIQGRHEYEAEARGEAELRRDRLRSAEQMKGRQKTDDKALGTNASIEQPGSTAEGAQSRPKQNYTRSPAEENESALGGSSIETEMGENETARARTGRPSGHMAEEDEARLRGSTRPGSASVTAGAKPDKSASTFTEAQHIHGHLAQEGEAKLRLGGQAEPEAEVEVATAEMDIAAKKTKPVFVAAERVQGHSGKEIEAIGKAELSNGDQLISAERLKYNQETDDAEAEGSVRVEQRGDILEGSQLKLNLLSKTGQLSQPNYRLKDASSRGYAETLLFEGENQYRLKKATYTTCPAGDDDWFLQVANLKLDDKTKKGTARTVKLTFLDVPILYTPWMNFSYSGQRKSGLLAPLYGVNAKTGLELTVPFYWNIAPNYDATVSARLMSKRGVAFNNELRYLGENSNGTLLADVLPRDLSTGQTRWRTSLFHNYNLGYGFSTRIDYNQVSDDTYFRDLGNSLNLTSRTNLLQQGIVSYNRALGDDGTLNFSSLVQSFQTIQDPRAPIAVPYKRLPQFTVAANKPDVFGMDLNLIGSWSNFSHPTQINGTRLVLFPSVSYPLRNSFGYITPKIGVHHTRYNLDATASPDSNPNRTIPMFSVDSGIAFDRGISLGGERFTQTLEPRLFYVYVPFRDQSHLPNFDSARTDFSFAQMLTENRFSGSDRINDANQVTLALTSRLIAPSSGKELVRVTVGQQLSFIDRRIVLEAPGTINRRPDFVAAVTGFITPTISTDSSVQYDQTQFMVDVVRSGLSYRPEPGRVVNVGYRFTRDVLHQVDASSQWRWSEKWQTVARLNYSLQDQRILEGLAGLEYNACCWSLRFVLQHLITATQKTTTAAFLQLELNGLMQIGSNPLNVLQRSIPGYTRTGVPGNSLMESP